MPNFAPTLSRSSFGSARFGGQISTLVRAFGLALQVRKERRMLQQMDQRALKDLGLRAGEAHSEASRTFWDIPVDRLRA